MEVSQKFQKSQEYFAVKRNDLVNMVPSSCKNILDVGCGSGENWRDFNGSVSGIEINAEAAEKARAILKNVVNGDIQKDPPFEKNSFDCVVFADVLEHLYDPWSTLEKYKKFLVPQGYVLVSIPNIRHYSIIKNLVFRGQFKYTDSGIMDIDHVRFFTKNEILNMLNQGGFEVKNIFNKISATNEYKIINTLAFGKLKDLLTEQFYVLGQLK